MKTSFVIFLSMILLLTACAAPTPDRTPSQATMVITHGTLIDGTGADPIPNAVLVIRGERILSVGPASQVEVPSGAQVFDMDGTFILPGFINAHVHDAYDESRLETWAQAGVTTVRDEGILSDSRQLTDLIALRNRLASSPKYARLVASGYMLSVPGGYGQLAVTSAEDARQQVNKELDSGVDLIKLAMESGYAGVQNLPNPSTKELAAIVAATHERGKLVSAHITTTQFLQQVVDAGVDDVAHIPWDGVPQTLIDQLIRQNIYVVPTLTVFEAYNALEGASNNLRRFVEVGVPIALGNDYTHSPQNNFNHFDLGMPMHEIERMNEAGMTSMQVIVAGTHNAAHVCGLEQELGTLEAGKIADLLIVRADPLRNLSALTQVEMVIHSGEIIRK